MDKQPNVRNLPPELIEKIQRWEENRPENKQLQVLADIASIAQELINVGDDSNDKSDTISKQLDALGAVLTDSREQLVALNKKEAPETPDYAKPVVQAIDKLLKALEKKDFAPEIKPNINVAAPDVKVTAPVDLKGVEKLLKTDLPKAFEKAISLMPEVQIPEPDNKPLLDAWEGISEQLASIDTATRMKPAFPTTMKVVNEDGTPLSLGLSSVDTATSAGVTVADTSTTVLAVNANRKSATIVNDSDETIYLKLGSGASLNSGIRINANGGSAKITEYTGIITAISTSGGKVVTVTEL